MMSSYLFDYYYFIRSRLLRIMVINAVFLLLHHTVAKGCAALLLLQEERGDFVTKHQPSLGLWVWLPSVRFQLVLSNAIIHGSLLSIETFKAWGENPVQLHFAFVNCLAIPFFSSTP